MQLYERLIYLAYLLYEFYVDLYHSDKLLKMLFNKQVITYFKEIFRVPDKYL